MWRRLRQLIGEKGIDPAKSVMIYFASEEPYYEFGVILGSDGEVYQFTLDYLNRDVIQGTLAEWDKVTTDVEKKPWRKQAALARELREKSDSDG